MSPCSGHVKRRDLVAALNANGRAADVPVNIPFGYETMVGDSGLSISGGQRQRIAIARGIYHRPPLIIMDEATSALDAESELAVKQHIDELLRGRTSFVIAHRLSTVRDADVILVLENGVIVERGTRRAARAAWPVSLPRQAAAGTVRKRHGRGGFRTCDLSRVKPRGGPGDMAVLQGKMQCPASGRCREDPGSAGFCRVFGTSCPKPWRSWGVRSEAAATGMA